MVQPITTRFPASAYRVGRADQLVHFSEIDAIDAELSRQGNRFDVVGGGVMYCATTKLGAYKEVLASFRPSPKKYRMREGESLMEQGSVPSSWRDKRRIGTIALSEPLPFLDIEKDETLTYLSQEMADELDGLGYGAGLDSGLVRGPNRLLTRAIASWAYRHIEEDGTPVYGGIRYSSRFESNECWAVFSGAVVGDTTLSRIELKDRDLQRAAREFGITLH